VSIAFYGTSFTVQPSSSKGTADFTPFWYSVTGKMVLFQQKKLGTTNKIFVGATKNFAVATKRFVDRTKHFVATICFCYPYFNK